MIHEPPKYEAAYSHVEGSQDDEVVALLRWLGVDARNLFVVTPQVSTIRDADVARALSQTAATVESVRNMSWRSGAAVLALWLDDEQLDDVERRKPAKLAVAGWWLPSIDIWRRARAPVEVTGAPVPDRVQLDPVVRRAMESVAHSSNPANGLNGYNKGAAVEAFRILRNAGYSWDPIECAVIMAENGWRLGNARKFSSLSEDMLAGKALKGSFGFRKDILKHWQSPTT